MSGNRCEKCVHDGVHDGMDCARRSFGCAGFIPKRFTLKPQPKAKGWRERFDKKFPDYGAKYNDRPIMAIETADLVEFIASELARVHKQYRPVVDNAKQFVRDVEFKIEDGDGLSAECMDKHYDDFKSALAKLEKSK